MIHWIVLVSLCVSAVCSGQIPYLNTSSERLNIEVVPVFVISEDTAFTVLSTGNLDELEALVENHWVPLFTQMFVATRNAMLTLGVGPHEYNLQLGDLMQFMVCTEANLGVGQQCVHQELGEITDLPNFAYNLYDGQNPPLGTVQLSIMLLEENIAWNGVLGLAWRWYQTETLGGHWTNTACRAWALYSVPVITHELGHCFGLVHNENDADIGLDLMATHYAHYEWVKDSNLELVREHFEYPIPAGALSYGDRPLEVELHF